MKKIKFIKDWKDTKNGEIVNYSDAAADNFISEGYAEYIDEVKEETNKIINPTDFSRDIILEEKFSFYNAPINNKYSSKDITVGELIDMIKSDKYKSNIDIIKAEPNKDKRTALKSKLLDYVTVGGVFKERAKEKHL